MPRSPRGEAGHFHFLGGPTIRILVAPRRCRRSRGAHPTSRLAPSRNPPSNREHSSFLKDGTAPAERMVHPHAAMRHSPLRWIAATASTLAVVTSGLFGCSGNDASEPLTRTTTTPALAFSWLLRGRWPERRGRRDRVPRGRELRLPGQDLPDERVPRVRHCHPRCEPCDADADGDPREDAEAQRRGARDHRRALDADVHRERRRIARRFGCRARRRGHEAHGWRRRARRRR